MTVRTVACAALLLALLLATACGAGGQGERSSASPPTPGASAPAVKASPAPTVSTPAVAQPRLPVSVTDKDGRKVTVTDASRIVSLNGDITEVIFALGLGANLVGVDTSATYPAEAQQLPKIGYQRQLAAEGILSLNPSVVIGNENAGPPAVIDQLRGTGVAVVIIPATTTIDGALVKIRAVAEALGVPEQGERVAATTRGEIDAALARAARATEKPKVAFLYVRGAGTQMIGGKGTAADALIAAAGGIDAGVTAGIDGFKPLTAEALVTAAPDVLLLLSAGLESVGGVDGLLALPGVAQTPAGRTKRVLHYADQYLLGMGPRVGQALMDLVKGLHPELQ